MELTRVLTTPAPSHRDVSVPVRHLAVAAISIAAGCAFVMFSTLLLIERNSSRSRETETVVATTVVASQAALPTAAPVLKPELPENVSTPEFVAPTSAPVQFSLAHSWHYQKLGPSSVKLLRTNTKRNDFDLAFLVQGRTISKHRLKLNEPVMLAGSSQPSTKVAIINRVTKTHIYGVLLEGDKSSAAPQLASNHPPANAR